jgi:hypothetical protein
MSRNKQVDRLLDGINVFIDTDDVKDPVGLALDLLHDQNEELLEDREFFKGLHGEILFVGFREDTVITRRNSTPISLKELGFVNDNPSFATKEDRARLITIVGMILLHQQNQLQGQGQVYKGSMETLTKRFNKLCDKFHKTLMELGIWSDPIPGKLEEMLESFRESYSSVDRVRKGLDTLSKQQHERIMQLQVEVDQGDKWREKLCGNISGLVKDLNFQRARADQFEKELKAMRHSIIKSKA